MRIMMIGGGSLGLLFASRLSEADIELGVVTRTSEQSKELVQVV